MSITLQHIIVFGILAACVFYAGRLIYRRLTNTADHCSGCALGKVCKKKKKLFLLHSLKMF